jgi:arylsulfatase A-like enzyme
MKSPTLSRSLYTIAIALSAVTLNAAKRPNIVFLLTDDQSTYTMGCYGNSDAKTPHLDQLAREGMLFDNHYDTTAICMASRVNVMTGMYEYKSGCNFEHGPLLRTHWNKTYPMLLRQAGYTTAFAGKFGFVIAEEAKGKGTLPDSDFDRWGGGPGQTTYATAKNASMAHYAEDYPHATRSYGAFSRDFIQDASKEDSPFCLSISFKASHRPDTPDPIYDHVYADKQFKKPLNYGREFGEHFSKQSQQGRQYDRFESWDYDKDYDGVMRRYHQQIYAVDVAVSMIRQALNDAGVADNTVIIFTSDNGFLCGSHGYGSKVLPYEESTRVPLIIFDPRHPNSGKQLRSDALTANIDFAPTILNLAGLPIPSNMDGKSLMPIYEKPTAQIHDTIQLINVWGPRATHSLAVVSNDLKYIYWPNAEEGFEPTEELFHTSKDPLELKNVIGQSDYTTQLNNMRQSYDNAIRHWQNEAVPYHNYQGSSFLFNRHIDWEDKRPHLTR